MHLFRTFSIICTLGLGLASGCIFTFNSADDDIADCGPSEAVVAQVIDGDTVKLDSGERVRYLLVDTPEVSGTPECYGDEATSFNRNLVEGQTVALRYDTECQDRYGRLLAYIEVEGRSVNELLLERGFACVLHIPPNGIDEVDGYQQLEERAEVGQVGMWGQCPEVACD